MFTPHITYTEREESIFVSPLVPHYVLSFQTNYKYKKQRHPIGWRCSYKDCCALVGVPGYRGPHK